MSFVRLGIEDGIAMLTMTSPENRNAFTTNAEVEEFLMAVERVGADRHAKVLVVTGDGTAFSAGGNIRQMHDRSIDSSIAPVDERHRYRTGIQKLPLAMHELEVPTIAAINGPAIGVGLDLACMCDIRIASERALMAESFVKLGIVPGDGGAWLLQRAVGYSKAAELSFTGDQFDAHAALTMGLVSRVVPHDQLLAEANALAARIARNPPEAVRMTKRLMREAQVLSLRTVLEMSAAFQALAHFTDDHRQLVAKAASRKS